MDELFGPPEDDSDADEGIEDEGVVDEDEVFIPDPSTIAFLDQEAAAFAEVADEFELIYGFRHECRCDQDYTEGKVGEVTECYAGMVVESLATCARLNYENKQLKALASKLMEVQEQIATTLTEGESVGSQEEGPDDNVDSPGDS